MKIRVTRNGVVKDLEPRTILEWWADEACGERGQKVKSPRWKTLAGITRPHPNFLLRTATQMIPGGVAEILP